MVLGRRSGRRGEGITEYVAILSLIMVCSIVGLFSAGSRMIRSVAHSKKLCLECSEEERLAPEADRDNDGIPDDVDELDDRDHDGDGVPNHQDEDYNEDLDDTYDYGTDADTDETSGGGGFWSNLGDWWSNSYLSSFAGLFGWFGWAG